MNKFYHKASSKHSTSKERCEVHGREDKVAGKWERLEQIHPSWLPWEFERATILARVRRCG